MATADEILESWSKNTKEFLGSEIFKKHLDDLTNVYRAEGANYPWQTAFEDLYEMVEEILSEWSNPYMQDNE